jgi:hypothetical protein
MHYEVFIQGKKWKKIGGRKETWWVGREKFETKMAISPLPPLGNVELLVEIYFCHPSVSHAPALRVYHYILRCYKSIFKKSAARYLSSEHYKK